MTFRGEIHAWLEECCPAEMRTAPRGDADDVWGGRGGVFPCEAARVWLERAAAKGITAPTWPREYGGAGMSVEEARVLAEEMRALGCRPPLKSLGVWMLGPVLLRFGSEEQKREHLARIARGEIRWCQGYSEPGAGSDLAGLATRAERTGDVWVVNGQKVWTSHADKADWMFALVRTDPAAQKHQGIGFLLIDLATPGVTVRPIRLISGTSPFCETFFDDVRVPARNLVGQPGEGWTIAKALLEHERALISGARSAQAEEEEPLEVAARRYGVEADPLLRDRMARVAIDELALRLVLREGTASPSVTKVFGTEISKRRRELRVEILGTAGLGWEGEGFSTDELAATRDWLRSRASSIEGGTTEIQLNIIAKRILGLPDA